MYRSGRISRWLVVAFACLPVAAQTSDTVPEALYDPRELEMRDRYEQTLLRDPFQEQSFKKVYESYLTADGLAAWIEKLSKPGEDSEPGISSQILLGRIRYRQFKTDEARAHLEQAKALGETRPDFNILFGTVLYQSGRDSEAIGLLSGALDGIVEAEKRGRVCRMLGNLYLRQGKRTEAIDVWKRLIDQGNDDPFAYQELAEIYEDNLMWEEAIGVYEQIAERAANDPYARCKSLRSIGGCQIQLEQHEAAIASYEKGLEMVAPGNWLFEDLKLRLVSVYQDLGDLEGLSRYLIEKIEAVPADIEFRDLLAETYTRMGSLELAESEYRTILERNPGKTDTYEKRIALSTQMEQPDHVNTLFEELIALYPTEPDYYRRLGEHHLAQGEIDLAKATWGRVLGDTPTAGTLALLAEWHEGYEYVDEAIAFYNRALELRTNKEWIYRVGTLTYELGQNEEALAIWLSAIPPNTEIAEDYAECSALIQSYGLYEDAAPLWEKAIALAPEHSDYRLALARNLLARDAYDDALSHFQALADDGTNAYFRDKGERGVLDVYTESGVLQEKLAEWKAEAEANPESSALKVKLARLYERLRNRTEATILYSKAVDLDPENTEYLHILARAQEGMKQFDEAIESYNRLLDLDKNRAGGYYRELLSLLVRQGRKDEAIETAKAIVELTPSDPEARTSLAQVYTEFGEADEALQQYRYALRLESSEPDYYQQYGAALEAAQRLGEAQDAFRKMLDAATEDQTRLQAVGHLSRIHLQQGLIDELTTEFQARARNTPKKLSAYDELAAIYKESGNIPRALEVMENAYGNVDDKETALRSLVRESYNAQDFNKVVKYYEQLLAMFGKPSMFELERLGRVYAQMGDMETARATWSRITETNPDDAFAYETLAKALKGEGFFEESLVETERSIELDPKNHRLRFAYAQDLMGTDQADQAMQQLSELLEQGDREKEEAEEEAPDTKKQTSRRIGRSLGGYEQLRPQVLQTLIQLATNTTGIDGLIETYQKKRELNPEDEQAMQDLVMLYQTANRFEDVLELHLSVLARNENDAQTLMKVAQTYRRLQDLDNAFKTYERVAELDPSMRPSAVQMMANIHTGKGEPEKAEALYVALLEDEPENVQVLAMAANMFQQSGNFESARALHDRIEKIDPNMGRNLRFNTANQMRQRGNFEEANNLLSDILFGSAPAARAGTASGKPALYAPTPRNASFLQGPRFMNDLSVLGFQLHWDQYAMQAFTSLVITPTDDAVREKTITRIGELARRHQNADAAKDRQQGQVMALLFIGSHLMNAVFEEAINLVEEFAVLGKIDLAWENLRLYILAQQGRFDDMHERYETLKPFYASRPDEMQRAQAYLFHAQGEKEKVREILVAMAQKKNSPAQFMTVVQQMRNLGYIGSARALLEDHLKLTSRNLDVLNTLARLYQQEGDNERAYEIGKEVWESTKGHRRGRPRGGGFGGGNIRPMGGGFGSGGFFISGGGRRGGAGRYMQLDGNLRQYFNYARAVGKADALIEEFEEMLEQSPGSVNAHTDLAGLYQLNNKPEKQLEVFRQLKEKRPNDVEVKLAMAQVYQNQRDMRSALETYEELLVSKPNAFRAYYGQVRNLYQQLGDFKGLAAFDEQMVRKMTTPQDMQNLAQQWGNEGKHDEAIAIYQKLVNKNPRQAEQYYSRMAPLFQQAGRMDEALEMYETWLGAAKAGPRQVNANLGLMATAYSAVGRLDELKERNAKELVERPDEPHLIAIDAYIAKLEGRIDDALDGFDRLRDKYGNNNFRREIIAILEASGDIDRAMTYLEDWGKKHNNWDYDRLARLALAKGDNERAIEYLKRNMVRYGGSGYRHINMLNTLLQYGLRESAEKYYSDNLKTVLGDTNTLRQFNDLAVRYYFSNGFFRAAIVEQYRLFNERQRESLVAALEQRGRGDSPRIGGLLETLLELDPDNESLLNGLAQHRHQTQTYKAEVAVLERLQVINPDKADYSWRLAQALKSMGRESDAVRSLKAWVDEEPGHDRLQMFTRLLKELKRFHMLEELRDHYLELAGEDSREQWARLFVADVQSQKNAKKNQTAEEQLETLRNAFEDKKNGPAFNAYIDQLIDREKMDEAVEFYESNHDTPFAGDWRRMNQHYVKLALHQENTEGLLSVYWESLVYKNPRRGNNAVTNAIEQAFHGESEEGKELFEAFEAKISAEETPARGALEALARIYENHLKRPDDALKTYDTLLARYPRDVQTLNNRARVLGSLERFDEQIATLQSVVKASPTPQHGSGATVNLASAYVKMEEPEMAHAVLDELRDRAGDANTGRAIGDYYYNQKDWESAISDYERVMRDPNYRRQVIEKLAVCYLNMGKEEEALVLIEGRTTRGNLGSYLSQVSSEGLSDPTLGKLEKLTRSTYRDHDAQKFISDAYYERGNFTALRAFYENTYRHLPQNYRQQLAQAYGQLIREKECDAQLLALGDLSTAPALARALVGELRNKLQATSEPEARAALLEPFNAVETLETTVMFTLAEALRSIDEDAARDWFLKVAEAEDALPDQRLSTARGLREMGVFDEAYKVYTEMIAARPSLLASEYNLRFLAEHGSPESNELLIEQLSDIARCEAQFEYLRGLLHFYVGDKDKAIAILEPLEEEECLTKNETRRAKEILGLETSE